MTKHYVLFSDELAFVLLLIRLIQYNPTLYGTTAVDISTVVVTLAQDIPQCAHPTDHSHYS
jgi:hypothetical protein